MGKPRGSKHGVKCRYWMPELISFAVIPHVVMSPPTGLAYALRYNLLNDGTINPNGVVSERVLVDSPLSEST